MPYTHITLATLRSQLAARLSSPDGVFWIPSELDDYILESLRVYGALTGFWRAQASFNTVQGTTFYNITTINAAFTAILGYTLTDTSLVRTIQHHFLEPASGDSWAGTSMFNLSDVTRALQHRRDQFLAETGVVITRSTPAVSAAPTTREALADTIIDLRRVVWNRDSDSENFHLWREDEHNLSAFDQGWKTAGVPIAYSVSAAPPITMQLAPPASVTGTFDLLHVSTGASLDPSSGVVLGVPDDLAWAIKWGAMADLLSHGGEARDPRAAFCEERFKLGVAVARSLPVVIHADIAGTPILPDSLHNLDAFRNNWQNDTQGAPDTVVIAGHNLIAVSPPPDGVYSITLDVVQRADVPTGAADNVEIGREDLSGIIDYAEHLAAFKIGGAELNLTQQQASNFLSRAVLRNQLMDAGTRGSLKNMFAVSKRETEADRPRRGAAVGQ